jgi:dihydrofolate synthase/folylpolyglutamate synthase
MRALDEILTREFFGVKLGLDPMRALCARLDHPELAAPSVLIAGTNGKGSVAAMTARACRAAGLRVGRYTSPHLVSLAERFAIDDVALPLDTVEDAAQEVLRAEAAAVEFGDVSSPMTFFELTTAVAFVCFARAGVDVAVLEVGLGGRLDATNVASPSVSVITTIDLDHTEHLGTNLEQIAGEKAGILRAGIPAVTGVTQRGPLAVIREAADRLAAPLVVATDGTRAHASLDTEGRTRLRLITPVADYGPLTLALRGAHQVLNAVVAVRTLEALTVADRRVPPEAVVAGLTDASWPGRLELRRFEDGRMVLLDAAHNPAGAAALASYLQAAGLAPLPIVFGVVREKACDSMLRALAPVASRLIVTEPVTRRARPAEDIVTHARSIGFGRPVSVARSPADALRLAWAEATGACVTGSIFLVGDVMSALDRGAGGHR